MDTFPVPTSYSQSVSPIFRPTMVKVELEAAEALAALGGAESVSRPVDNKSTAHESTPVILDLEQHYVKTCDFMSEKVKMEKYGDLKRDYPCMTNTCKSRQNLTEAEEESRKLRRVLANRESARQTIRRRQAFYEELLKKAGDLASENEKLKKEKEKTIKEYDSSKRRNELLKAQMSELMKSDKIPEAEEDAKSNDVFVNNSYSGSATTCPVFIYSQPYNSQFLWPSIVQPSDSVQSPAQIGPAGNPDSFFLFQFPFLFPLPCNNSGPQVHSSSLFRKQEDEENCVSIQHFGTSNRVENCGAYLSRKVQPEVSNSVLELENRHHQGSGRAIKSCFLTSGNPTGLPEKYPAFWRREKINSAAAAEARRKMKEVTRLKHLHLHLSTYS